MLDNKNRLKNEIVDFLKFYVTPEMKRKMAFKYDISTELINAIIRQDRSVTAKSKKAIKEIINLCKKEVKKSQIIAEKI